MDLGKPGAAPQVVRLTDARTVQLEVIRLEAVPVHRTHVVLRLKALSLAQILEVLRAPAAAVTLVVAPSPIKAEQRQENSALAVPVR